MKYDNDYSLFYATFAIVTYVNVFTKQTWIINNYCAYNETYCPE
jgi:hypothetical protein